MKKIIFFLLVLTRSIFPMNPPIQMPSADVLRERFQSIGFDHFFNNSTIVSVFAGTQKRPSEILDSLELVMSQYSQSFIGSDRATTRILVSMSMNRRCILSRLLEEAPEVLEQLIKESLVL